jgi:hypothetical protein
MLAGNYAALQAALIIKTVAMEAKNSVTLFESKQVRSVWDSEQEK